MKKGFTLIELLVVIAIIALLSSVVLASLASARAKSRDARRIADLRQIATALELYNDKYGYYPDATTYGESEGGVPPNGCGGFDTSKVDLNTSGNALLDPLVTDGFMTRVPVDPTQGIVVSSYTPPWDCNTGPEYRYAHYTAGTYGCATSSGGFYVLESIGMESVTGRHPQSPGFACSGRDWNTDASGHANYVFGGYEK